MNNARDIWTVQAMETYGGSFVKALAKMALHADPQNLAKIKATWPEYWMQYEVDGIAMQERAEKPV